MRFNELIHGQGVELAKNMDCYLPNNPQFGISVEYTTQITPAAFGGYPAYPNYDTGQEELPTCGQTATEFDGYASHDITGDRDLGCSCGDKRTCGKFCADCDKDGNELNEEFNLNQEASGDGIGASYWTAEDLGSFSLSGLDIESNPGLFPCSPCNGNHRIGISERLSENTLGEVQVSLKHHTDCSEAMNSTAQMVVPAPSSGPYQYYEQYASPPLFPTMSVNVSMNMTMHSYPHDQVQWNQQAPQSVNMIYPQSQNMLSPSSYQGPTYSFTADFRGPTQSDPLITSTSFLGSPKGMFKSTQRSPDLDRGHCMKTRSKMFVDQGYQYFGEEVNECGFNSCGVERSCSGGRVQIGSLSTCSGSEDEQKPNLCRICGKTYARPSTLKTHLRTHSGERPYRCGDCNKSFSQAANLTAHVRTHTGQKPFRCPICDRRFSQSSSVTTHMRTHSGERPYRCRSCKKAFSDSSTLTKHLRIHSGEKPYQCKLCLLRFSQSGNLNRHMRVHGQSSIMD